MFLFKVNFYNSCGEKIAHEYFVIDKDSYAEAEKILKEKAAERCKEYLDARDYYRRTITFDYYELDFLFY